MANKRIGAGVQFLYWGVLDNSARFAGVDSTGITAGTQALQPMLRLRGAQTFPVSAPDNESIDVIGDDDALTSFDFAAATLPGGVFEMAARDNNFDAVVQGTKVQTLAQWESGVIQPDTPAFTQMRLVLNRRSKKFESGVEGAKAWEVLFIPNTTVTPKYTEVTTRQHTPYRYSFKLAKGARNLWGATLTEILNGTEQAAFVIVDSDNPVLCEAGKGNASRTAFTLSKTPVDGTNRLAVTVNDVLQVYTTHYTVSGTTLTFVAAPASDAIVNVAYEVAESDLS